MLQRDSMVLPRVLKNLVDQRKVVKSLLKAEKDPNKYTEVLCSSSLRLFGLADCCVRLLFSHC